VSSAALAAPKPPWRNQVDLDAIVAVEVVLLEAIMVVVVMAMTVIIVRLIIIARIEMETARRIVIVAVATTIPDQAPPRPSTDVIRLIWMVLETVIIIA